VWCVRVTPADLRADEAWKRLAGRYVEVTGQPVYLVRGGKQGAIVGILDADVILDPDCQGADGLGLAAWVFPRRAPPSREEGPERPGSARGRMGPTELILPCPSGAAETYRGRVVQAAFPRKSFQPGPGAVVDERMWQFGGEFFAGAAVAAMGALVLTLYLRRWLVERREQGRSGEASASSRGETT